MKKKLSAHQETISILSQAKDSQIKLYKTRKDKELDKVIALENKVKVLDNIVYKTGQLVQTMNMLNSKCQTSFVKPEFLKKAQRANPRLYDICCYNDNLALMLALESEKVIRLEKESRSRLSDLIRPFDYDKLNNLYDLFVPQREKSSEQGYFSKRSRMSHTPTNCAIVIPNLEETLLLVEESSSKMLLKQKDPMVSEKKVNTKPIDYSALNQLLKDFATRFVPQSELSTEQVSCPSSDHIPSNRPTIVEVPRELPKVSMVNTSLQKLKRHLAGFEVVVKERTMATAITEGSWGFEHIKACFKDEIIPFVKKH
uniref:Uncharacterized protein n=1 Tax=Tanacetum cinerariifolium TaxID=118510 RepID=A0A699K3G3_TANCI|nr:hypothetical protein [Tanacetum cinerariifolium]